MNGFTLRLQDAMHTRDYADVDSFVGEDASGSFGVRAGHARLMTTLVPGLARFHSTSQGWQYLAMPGAVLYFHDNVLFLSTRRVLIDSDFSRISRLLEEQLLVEEEKLHDMKESLQRLEKEILRHLWEAGRLSA